DAGDAGEEKRLYPSSIGGGINIDNWVHVSIFSNPLYGIREASPGFSCTSTTRKSLLQRKVMHTVFPS
ncbi:MAG: hypothetical protein PUP91_39050, partial [Rhizonema sp. PD37]|nr:hypothetical protein [Rhizonema sp. PD37]